MSHKFRIAPSFDYNNEYFPVGAFFDSVPNHDFVPMLGCLADGTGYHFNETGCFFPDDSDLDEEPFEGIKFVAVNESIVLSPRIVYSFLQLACEAYLEDFPQDRERVEELERKFFDGYCK